MNNKQITAEDAWEYVKAKANKKYVGIITDQWKELFFYQVMGRR